MVRHSSYLLFALASWLCILTSQGVNLREEKVSMRQLEDGTEVWDYDYGISQSSKEVVYLDRYWHKIFVTIGDKKFAAALSDEGLFVHASFESKIPRTGEVVMGPNKIPYNLEARSYIEGCPIDVHEPLILKGAHTIFPHTRDTWIKKSYFCKVELPIGVCYPNFSWADWPFGCDDYYGGKLTNGTDDAVLPLWNQRECSFLSKCAINNNFVRLLDANVIFNCYESAYFDQKCWNRFPTAAPTPAPTTLAPTPAPTSAPTVPAPTQAPTYHVPDCGVPTNSAELLEYPSVVSGLGYVYTSNIKGNGVQYHLVPSNPSSCPASFVNMFEREEVFYFPEGCEGYLYATVFRNLRCTEHVNYKFKYQQKGGKVLHMTMDGKPFFF